MAESPQVPETDSGPEIRTHKGPVLLNDRYAIDPGQPLADLDTPSAMAFAVEDRRQDGRSLFALICAPDLPVRTGAMAVLKGDMMRGLMPLVDWGPVEWSLAGQKCVAVVYERPLGGRISAFYAKGERFSEHELPQRVIEPISVALREMMSINVSHRAIRPDNLFFMDEERQQVVLGDCLTTPAGFDQPIVFEPMERGMALPEGRGTGDFRDDLYAFGVTIVFLLLGKNPVDKVSGENLIMTKIEQGTYATLCGHSRVPMSMLEPLRGMLSDDPNERWSPEDLEQWTSGRKATPIQKKASPRAEMRLPFAGREHATVRTLAFAMTRNVREAAVALKKGQIDLWLRRGLKDVKMAEAILSAVQASESQENSPAGSDDFLVTKVAILMDPDAPIRYRGFSFMPEGFGPALAVALLRKGDAQVAIDVVLQEIPGIWCSMHLGMGGDASALAKTFAQIRLFLLNKDPGFGVERCLYERNTGIPCQSPLIQRDQVLTIEELLPALDEAAKHSDLKVWPIDRHVTAFIAARFNQDVGVHLRAIADRREDVSLVGMLSLLAYIQWRLKQDTLFGLASWVGGLLGAAIESYHSRTTRREIEREIPRLVRQGSLPELFDLIDNAERRRQDEDAFAAAVIEFATADAEAHKVETSDAARSDSAAQVGQQSAAMTSVVMTMVIIAIIFLMKSL